MLMCNCPLVTVFQPHLMCYTLGLMHVDVLNNFCSHLTHSDVSTATFVETLNRCGDCLAVAHASRTNEDVSSTKQGQYYALSSPPN